MKIACFQREPTLKTKYQIQTQEKSKAMTLPDYFQNSDLDIVTETYQTCIDIY